MINYHRSNLKNGTFLKDEQGTTTVYITGVQGPDGREYNVPGYWDGKRHTPEEAAQRAAKIGWDKFPSYATPAEGEAAAQRMHKIIESDASFGSAPE